jgi:hypothetical protein
VGTLVVFRVGHADAERFEQEFGGELKARQFADLDRHHAYVRRLADGVAQEPVVLRTLPPMAVHHRSVERLIRRSRERYARPRAEVEAKLERWLRG